MFSGCMRTDAVPSGRHNMSTPCQCVLDELRGKYRNPRLQFLILLREEDYQKCLYSYRDMIMYRKHNFPGDLIIEKYEDCDQLPYAIKDPPIPRQLYIMLPKEKLFVVSESFAEMYLRSKIRELIQLFVTLNAKSVKFMRYDAEKQHNHVCLEVGLAVPQATVSLQSRIENENAAFSGTQYVMSFADNGTPFDPNELLSDQFYYLREEPSWQDIVTQRVDYKMSAYQYSYQHHEQKILKRKFVAKMKMLDLSADYNAEQFKDFAINYDIEYHPLLVKDTCV